ncbi:MAG: hypothetical protein AMJ89_04290 [candidate division Zixibacteria bacterium SM23_73]|nr:MAG: hypothetical protein AMJ89_04290 [candidate division Zixibacteria bacterium SM23_73]
MRELKNKKDSFPYPFTGVPRRRRGLQIFFNKPEELLEKPQILCDQIYAPVQDSNIPKSI